MAGPATEHIVICNLGLVEYDRAWELQRRIQARLIEAKRRHPAEAISHVMLLLEHPPVFTLGKSGNPANLLASEDLLAHRGATFRHIDRGGDVTFHGPGQIVGYPILDLDRFFTDVHRYLRELEEVIIRTCGDYGISAGRIEGKTGVWLASDDRARKICALGIRCSRWVTMHGFALNVNTDLGYFDLINPCGFTDTAVSSLARELEREVDLREVENHIIHHLSDRFEVTVERLAGDDAASYLKTFLQCAGDQSAGNGL
jgi:lipoyl(octanoyl) transferase